VSVSRRRQVWITATLLLGGALMVVGVVVPMPFVELAPGPTFNVIGDYQDEPVLTITGTTTYPVAGHLDMTTVNERGGPRSGINIGRLVVGWADPNVRVLPRSALFPDDDRSDADVKAENVRAFSDSQADAIAASLSYLDRPYDTLVVVSSVRDGTPADGKLEPGDQLLTVGSTPIVTTEDVGKAMSTVKPGDPVTIRYKRSGTEGTTTIVTTTSPLTPGRAFLGITVGTTYKAKAPTVIDFSLDGVGGPSAGLMFSLGIVDKLTPGELNGGKFVAGTGTMAPDGTVGPIGGIEQKLVGARRSGATLFLAPVDNCDAVLRTSVPDGLTVAKVTTLTDAVEAVEAYAAGKPVTPCS
jgi:PDZ domain-containing protein